MPDALSTIKLSECAIANFAHHTLDMVVPDTEDDKPYGKKQGAHVLDPVVGMSEYVAGIDIKSLYPSIQLALNVSPEKIIGQFIDNAKAHDMISKGTNNFSCINSSSDLLLNFSRMYPKTV